MFTNKIKYFQQNVITVSVHASHYVPLTLCVRTTCICAIRANAVRTSVLPKAGRVRRARSAEVTSADPTISIYTFTTKVLTDTKNIPPH